jgi:DNA-binding HxlR family transcriptional regulator
VPPNNSADILRFASVVGGLGPVAHPAGREHPHRDFVACPYEAFANLSHRVEATSTEPAPARGRARPTQVCPDFHAAVELIGKRWAGAIVWALAERPHYFAELAHAVPGLSDRLLSRRLRELEAEGLVERSVHPGSPARVSYALTDKGQALEPALCELRSWAKRWNGSDC